MAALITENHLSSLITELKRRCVKRRLPLFVLDQTLKMLASDGLVNLKFVSLLLTQKNKEEDLIQIALLKGRIDIACLLIKTIRDVLEPSENYSFDSGLIAKATLWTSLILPASRQSPLPLSYQGSFITFSVELFDLLKGPLSRSDYYFRPEKLKTLVLFFVRTTPIVQGIEMLFNVCPPELIRERFKNPFTTHEATLIEIAIRLNHYALALKLIHSMKKDKGLLEFYKKHFKLTCSDFKRSPRIFSLLLEMNFFEELFPYGSEQRLIEGEQLLTGFTSLEKAAIESNAHAQAVLPDFPRKSDTAIQKGIADLRGNLVRLLEYTAEDIVNQKKGGIQEIGAHISDSVLRHKGLQKEISVLQNTLCELIPIESDSKEAETLAHQKLEAIQAKEAEIQAKLALSLAPLKTQIQAMTEEEERLKQEINSRLSQIDRQKTSLKIKQHEHGSTVTALQKEISQAEKELAQLTKQIQALTHSNDTLTPALIQKQKELSSLEAEATKIEADVISQEEALQEIQTRIKTEEERQGPFLKHFRENGPHALGTQELAKQKSLSSGGNEAAKAWLETRSTRPKFTLKLEENAL